MRSSPVSCAESSSGSSQWKLARVLELMADSRTGGEGDSVGRKALLAQRRGVCRHPVRLVHVLTPLYGAERGRNNRFLRTDLCTIRTCKPTSTASAASLMRRKLPSTGALEAFEAA